MANPNDARRAQLLQAIDDAESPEALETLRASLETDPQARADFDRMRRTDRMLRAAPMEAAPERLALKIMAALAQRLNPEQMRGSAAALAIGLAAIALLLTPMLAVLGWLVVSAVGSATILGGVFAGVTALISTLMGALERIMNGAQDIMQTSPEAALLLLGLVPIAVLWMTRFRWLMDWDADDDGSRPKDGA
jgi:anti-sigma factor RsiW